jgi:agmatinase
MKSKQLDSSKSPRFAQPATFMRLPHQTDLTGVDVAMLGVPFDSGTSYRSGARLGPREIRAQSSLIRPYSYFQKISPFETLTIVDAGDVDAPPVGIEAAYAAIEAGVDRVLAARATPMIVGGDHSISLPVLRAVARLHGPVALVQFDAHIDTWGDYFGGKYFHGSPFRRAIEEGIVDPSRYVQIGIRGPMYGEDEDFEFQRVRGVTTIDIGAVKRDGAAATMARVREIVGSRPLYVTFDIDSVDPAFAPGTGTPEVGGLTSYEAQELVRGLAGLDLVACDVVEVAPAFDGPGQITALLAANLMFELLCVIAMSHKP